MFQRLTLVLALALGVASPEARDTSAFTIALDGAEQAIASGDLVKARALIDRALERDARATRAWAVRARWAEAVKDADELTYALHTQLRLAIAQKAPKDQVAALRAKLDGVDPIAKDLLGMNTKFIGQLEPVAVQYEKEGRPHSAIRVHKLILALEPDYGPSLTAIDRISSLPDPSLAGDAKPKDLLADVSAEWIREFDGQHATWEARSSIERENYTTYTNAGYEVMVRAAEAMEQMNAFYRVFFNYGTEEDGKKVPRIDLNIFAKRDEYLKLGKGPPVEWSGGHFTGDAVETYVEGQGFTGTTGTLFHEAAHQFVGLATNAAGWLNEGLASFFEGCRILPNGSVLMNMPATHRLFPLADKMDKGWMSSASDGISPTDASKSDPPKAPTFRIVLENEYEWGPPWYAPTWGVVFFLYNFQDPIDGRFIYRKAFREYVDKSGGLTGKTAIKTFEEVVLGNPSPPIKGVDRTPPPADHGASADAQAIEPLTLPKTVDELTELWKKWILALRDEQIGKAGQPRPYLAWARAALLGKDPIVAQEHFEKGLVATPEDVELLEEFGSFLAERKNTDRATKLVIEALRVLEHRTPVDDKQVQAADRLLAKWDPKRSTLERVQRELWTTSRAVVERYRAANLPMMVMDVSWRLSRDLGVPKLYELYAEALKQSGKSLQLWELAYNESSLEGWDAGGDKTFAAAGTFLDSSFKTYSASAFDFQALTLDKVTGGDFSLEADVQALRGEVNFCGLVFGRKNATNFHALIYFPGKPKQEGSAVADSAFIDLATFYGGESTKTWRHSTVQADVAKPGETGTSTWHKLRIDVAGNLVDAWIDGEPLPTQEFPNLDVLRGTFGLITGPGKARFKEVRFLARDAGDPAGAIERSVRMERIKQQGGGAVNGSWLGLEPPFPKTARWAHGSRANWAEKGPVLQLFVLWSIQQNNLVAIDGWLRELAEKYGALGLEIVSVTSPNDDAALDAYLKEHPFPGAVGLDYREGPGIGDTNKAFSTLRFNLPRLLLLDIDQKVAWEGDPGFSVAEPWKAGAESYIDLPLKQLVEKRKLDKLKPWLDAWRAKATAALHAGDLEAVLPLLQGSREFDPAVLSDVHDAQGKMQALEDAVAKVAATAADFEKDGRDPALRVLVDWAKLIGKEPDKRALAALKPTLTSPRVEAWDRALKQIETFREKIAKDPAVVAELSTKLATLKGSFPADLAARIRDAGSDAAKLAEVFDSAPQMPREWLAQDKFGW